MSWSLVARRIRVPVGFALAAAYLLLARPTWTSLIAGAIVAAGGLALRAVAAGHIRKNSQLATTGPYAYVRNPLYLGSIIIAAGFAVAARDVWVPLLLVIVFFLLYLPVVRAEEEYLRGRFPEFNEYAQKVPRFLPRFGVGARAAGAFSPQLYAKHREYNAALGTAALLAALAAKLLWTS